MEKKSIFSKSFNEMTPAERKIRFDLLRKVMKGRSKRFRINNPFSGKTTKQRQRLMSAFGNFKGSRIIK